MTTTSLVTTTWIIDPAHSEVQFKVKHLVITTVTGTFQEFSGTVTSVGDFENATIYFETDIHSLSTNNAQRDAHLKSADFFDADHFPKLSFTSTWFKRRSGDEFELKGNLTIRGVSRAITLAVEYGGTATDPWGNVKAGFELKGSINRKDFGLNWNATTETGGVLVSEEVKLVANIQLVRQ